jgi:hypothetical protein
MNEAEPGWESNDGLLAGVPISSGEVHGVFVTISGWDFPGAEVLFWSVGDVACRVLSAEDSDAVLPDAVVSMPPDDPGNAAGK